MQTEAKSPFPLQGQTPETKSESCQHSTSITHPFKAHTGDKATFTLESILQSDKHVELIAAE